MKEIKILMNNVGSQAIEIIELLHEENIYIIYLSSSENDAIKKEADEFIIYNSNNYLDIEKCTNDIINICKEKNVDLFIPFKEMEKISKLKDKFDKNDINILLPDDIDLFNKLNNKVETYNILKDIKEIIPEYYLVKNKNDFILTCEKLKNKNKDICMKYVTDIASNSFRIINFKEHNLKELNKKSDSEKSRLSHLIDYEVMLKILEKEKLPCDLIVMEYMPGKEISCDCLKTNKGNIIIPRIKENSKVQLIKKDKDILYFCNKILNLTNYNTPCNIQFKIDANGNIKLLEINTRMSGGVMIASWATDINIPLIAVKQACNKEINFNNDWKDLKMISRKSFDKIFI